MLLEADVFQDERGYFCESYNQAKLANLGISNTFVQDNQSKSCYGVVRGLHAQLGKHAQAKLIRVLSGSILDVAVDIRLDSPTFGQHIQVELSEDNHHQLFIPQGFLHGFAVLSQEATVLYKCDSFWCKKAEITVRYDDPTIGIDWGIPQASIITSDKDQQGCSLNELKYRLQQQP